MPTATMTEKDVRVRDAVQRQLDWDQEVDASAIGIAAKDGSVTLTGFIDSYAGKLAAERVAKRVRGVRAVANDVEVRLKLGRTDADIAGDAARRNAHLDARQIEVTVDGNTVTLTGTVRTWLERDSAESAVADGPGITTVINRIVVEPAEADDTFEIC